LAWTIRCTETATSQLRKLDRQVAQRILDYMEGCLASLGNARDDGKAPRGPLGGFWCYRVGDCRVICEIQDHGALVLGVRIGSRRDVYR